MEEITAVALDLAKRVFQVHAVEAEGVVVLRRQVKRAQLVLFFSSCSPP
jgi:transposase